MTQTDVESFQKHMGLGGRGKSPKYVELTLKAQQCNSNAVNDGQKM